jgi:hypothetical protein
MDIDSGPNGSESKLGPTGLCEAGTNHSLNYFYKDGSVYITVSCKEHPWPLELTSQYLAQRFVCHILHLGLPPLEIFGIL